MNKLNPLVQVVDEHDNPVNEAEIDGVRTQGLIHRVARVMLLNNEGKILLQKRRSDMKLFPGRWDNSAAGTVDAGESYEETAYRELAEEIGVEGETLQELGTYYAEMKWNGMHLKKFNRVYTTTIDYTPTDLQPSEVESVAWFTVDEIRRMIAKEPDTLTDGVIDVMSRYFNEDN